MAFSILSLDGGGTWALVQVKILQERYGKLASGHDVLKKYDLVIANSGGSLVLGAMCANYNLQEILDMFLSEDILNSIFVSHGLNKIFRNSSFPIPKFNTEGKPKGLRKQLKKYSDIPLTQLPELIGKSELQIVITGFDYDRERAVYFRSNSKSKMETGYIQSQINPKNPDIDSFKTVTLLNAIHASSNAPILYFDDPAEFSYYGQESSEIRRFWDGAVGGNNNPVTSGVLEALANGATLNSIRVVSIGTANIIQPVIYKEENEPAYEADYLIKIGENEGFFGDILKMAQSIISDPPDAATFITHQILRLPIKKNNPRLIRFNPLVKPILVGNEWKKPGNTWNDEDLEKLFEMSMAVTDKEDVNLIVRMTEDYINGDFQNQGIRIGGKGLEAIIGHKDFSSGLSDWKSWDDEQELV